MHEHDAVAALIDRVVSGARIPSRAGRDDLRRELWTHFEEADTSPESLLEALRQFGAESTVVDSFRRIHRLDYAFLYLLKVAASIIVSVASALLIQLLVNLRVEFQVEAWRLAPSFIYGARLSIGVVLALVTAWEIARPPFNRSRALTAIGAYSAISALAYVFVVNNVSAFVTPTVLVALGYLCSKLDSQPAKWLLTFGAFAVALYATHLVLSVAFGPARALASSAVLVMVWSATGRILAGVDHAFGKFLEIAN